MDLLQKYLIEQQLLDEGLDDTYTKYYKDKMPREVFDKVIAIDPTFEIGNDKLGVYGKWILQMWIKGEDLSSPRELTDTLKSFNEVKHTLEPSKRDIMKNKTVSEFLELARSLDVSNKSAFQLKAEAHAGVKFIAKNSEWEVYQPLTWEGSKFLRGSEANWCTGWSDNQDYWKRYTSGTGELYIFINSNPTTRENVKFQVAIRDGRVTEFRDARNSSASFIEFLALTGLFEVLDKTPIGSTKEVAVARKLNKFKGKLTFTDLMEIKYIGLDQDITNREAITMFYNEVRKVVEVIIVNNGITMLPEFALGDFENASTIVLPPSLTQIGKGCFFNCKSLTKISIPPQVKTIPSVCFQRCSGLKEVQITENTTEFGIGVFTDCPGELKIKSPRHRINVPKTEKEEYAKRIVWLEGTKARGMQESLLLEKLSPQMPDWFKRQFFSKETASKNSDVDARGLARNLYYNNIDVANVEIVEIPVPANARSPFLKEPYIPIYYIPEGNIKRDFRYYYDSGDVVYVKDINSPRYGWSASEKFEKRSRTALLKAATKFAYIDTSNPKNMMSSELAQERVNKKSGVVFRSGGQKHVPQIYYSKKGSDALQNIHSSDLRYYQSREIKDEKEKPKEEREWTSRKEWTWEKPDIGRDKSGYEIPSPLKFKIKLNELERQQYMQTLDSFYKRLEAIRTKLNEKLSSLFSDISTMESEPASAVSEAMDSFSKAVRGYKILIARIDYLMLIDDEERKNKELDQMFQFKNPRYISVDSNITSAEVKALIKDAEEALEKLSTDFIENLNN